MFLNVVYLASAVIGGTILVCQFVLAVFGLGHDGADVAHDTGGGVGDAHVGGDFHTGHVGDIHAVNDPHPDSTHLFAVISFRTLVAAAAFFGVTGLSTLSAGFPATTTLVLAMLTGLAAMYGMYGLLRLIAGLSSAGNERIGNAIGARATVYIPIPATGGGAGKVQLSMQNRIVEYQAVTEDAEPLKTGETVEVVGVKNSDTVKVRRAGQAVEQEPAAC